MVALLRNEATTLEIANKLNTNHRSIINEKVDKIKKIILKMSQK